MFLLLPVLLLAKLLTAVLLEVGVASAWAHSPHDVADFVAVAPDGAVWTTDTEVLAWSSDGFQFSFMYPTFGYPVCGFADSAMGLVLGTEDGGVWRTSDGAEHWEPLEGPQHVKSCGHRGDVRLIGGVEGVWESDDGGDFVPIGATSEDEGVMGVDVGADGTRARWAHARVATWSGSDWVDLPRTPEVITAMGVADDGAVWVGSATALYRSADGGDWVAVPDGPADARTFAFAGDTVLVGTSRTGIWFSLDSGVTWDLSDTRFEAVEDGPGSPADGVHFLDTEIAEDGSWWSAQWEGVWHLSAREAVDPASGIWRQGALDILPRTRTVQWVDGDDLLLGVYGGGIYRGVPGGRTWALYGAGVAWPYPKQVLYTPAEVFVVSGVALYMSTDDGATWSTGNVGVSEIGDHVTVAPDFPVTPYIVAAGRDDDHGLVVWSDDLGATWHRVELPGECSDKPTVVETDGPHTWIGCGPAGEVSLSLDHGQSWQLMATLGQNVNDILPEMPALFATDVGIVATSDGVTFDVAALDGTAVDKLVRGPDGTLWAAVPGEGVGKVVDGQWEPCGWPDLDRVEDLDVGPDGALAAGTREGAWVSDDDCQSWSRANNVEFVDAVTQFWSFSDAWVERDRPGAWATTDIGATAGDGGTEPYAELQFVGEQVRVRGSSLDGCTLRVTVDGAAEDVVVDPGLRDTGMVWGRDLEAGLHTVGITLVAGTLYLDGAEVWRADAPMLPESQPTEKRCGCAASTRDGSGLASGAAMMIAVSMVAALSLSRRRAAATSARGRG
jgi:hypothetical protein